MKRLELEIIARVEALRNQLSEVQTHLRSLDDSIQISGRRLSESLRGSFNQLKDFIFSVQGIITAVTAGTVGMITKKAISAAADFERQLMTLQTVATGTGSSLKGIADIIKTYAGGLFSPEDVMRAITYARSVGLQIETIKALLPLLKDTAAAYGEDLYTAMMAVVRAMRFGEAELAERIGLTLRENAILDVTLRLYGKRLSQLTQEQKEIAVLVAALEQMEKFRGAEARAMETVWGQWQKLRIVYREMFITIGQELIPIMKALLPVISGVFSFISSTIGRFRLDILKEQKKTQEEIMNALKFWQGIHKLLSGIWEPSKKKVEEYNELIKEQENRIKATEKAIKEFSSTLKTGAGAYTSALKELEKLDSQVKKTTTSKKQYIETVKETARKKKELDSQIKKAATSKKQYSKVTKESEKAVKDEGKAFDITMDFLPKYLEGISIVRKKQELFLDEIEGSKPIFGRYVDDLLAMKLGFIGMVPPMMFVKEEMKRAAGDVQWLTSCLSENELFTSKLIDRFTELANYMKEALPTLSETLSSFYEKHQEGLMRLGTATRIFTLGMRESLRELAISFVDYLINKISVAMLEVMAEKTKNIFILLAKGLAGELSAFARIPLLLAEFASTLAALAAVKASAAALKGQIRKMQFGGYVTTPFALAERGEFVLPRPTAEKFLRFLETLGERYYRIEAPRIINITINTSAAWNTQELENLARKVSRLLR
jgi:F0F1-type ATP synthase assembly protein I